MTETLETKSGGKQTFFQVAGWVVGALFIYIALIKILEGKEFLVGLAYLALAIIVLPYSSNLISKLPNPKIVKIILVAFVVFGFLSTF